MKRTVDYQYDSAGRLVSMTAVNLARYATDGETFTPITASGLAFILYSVEDLGVRLNNSELTGRSDYAASSGDMDLGATEPGPSSFSASSGGDTLTDAQWAAKYPGSLGIGSDGYNNTPTGVCYRRSINPVRQRFAHFCQPHTGGIARFS